MADETAPSIDDLRTQLKSLPSAPTGGKETAPSVEELRRQAAPPGQPASAPAPSAGGSPLGSFFSWLKGAGEEVESFVGKFSPPALLPGARRTQERLEAGQGAGAAAGTGVKQGVAETALGAEQLVGRSLPALLPGARRGQERALGALDRSIRERQAAYERQPEVAAHPWAAEGGRIGGDILATAPLGAGGGARTLAGRLASGALAGGAGAATSPVLDTDDYWTAKGKQVAAGAAMGAGAGAIGSALAPRGAAARLAEQGVPLTPGMQWGLQNFPVLNQFLRSGEAKSLTGFRQAVANQTLEPLGETVPRNVTGGHQLLKFVEDKIDDHYNQVLPKISFSRDAWDRLADSDEFKSIANQLPAEDADTIGRVLHEQFGKRFKDGFLGGEAYKLAERKFRGLVSAYDRKDPLLGDAMHDVQSLITKSLIDQNPQYAKELKNIDSSWAMWTRLRRAGSKAGTEGEFSPYDLLQAAQREDKSAGKGAFARGDAILQPFAEAANKTFGKITPPGSYGFPSTSLRRLFEELGPAGIGAGVGYHLGGLPGAALGAGVGAGASRIAAPALAAVGRSPAAQRMAATASGRAAAEATSNRDLESQRMKTARRIGELRTQRAALLRERAATNKRGALETFGDLGDDLRDLDKQISSANLELYRLRAPGPRRSTLTLAPQ